MKMIWFNTFTVWLTLNVAVAVRLLFIVTVHAPVPLQAPLHPAKKDPLLACAVSFTFVPDANEAEHVGEQLMPAGLLVTVPLLLPASVTVSV
jgi:hypothetical protein